MCGRNSPFHKSMSVYNVTQKMLIFHRFNALHFIQNSPFPNIYPYDVCMHMSPHKHVKEVHIMHMFFIEFKILEIGNFLKIGVPFCFSGYRRGSFLPLTERTKGFKNEENA